MMVIEQQYTKSVLSFGLVLQTGIFGSVFSFTDLDRLEQVTILA